jgi:predicted KAP-like P-loop ATPase
MTDLPPDGIRAGADRPLDDLAEDELGRDGFVAALQEEVRDAPPEGLVVGVTGDWGSGKTSVINMALNPLAAEADFRLVRFNPWLFSGTPQLIEHYFVELSSQLHEAGRRSKRDRLVRLSEALAGYADILDPLRFAPGVDAAVRAGQASSGLLARLGGKPRSAHEQKVALNKLLEAHDERLIVVMDDIDRLTTGEIRDVMRLVRLVGDFPNIVYVLAYAPKTVATALGGSEGAEVGQAYLEKIVQVTHAVPAIDPEQLSTLLLQRLTGTLAGVEYQLDQEHWSSMYLGMRPYFRTLRDVVRYCNATRAPARHLVGELDVADILGLEALRIFEPSVWESIDDLAEPLTQPRDQYLLEQEREGADEQLRALPDGATRPDQVHDLLRTLFPVAQRVLGRSNYGSDWMSSWRRQGRVAHVENLRVYLARQVTTSGASRSLVLAALDALRDPQRARAMLAAVDDARLPALLSRLADYEDELGIETAVSIPVLYELRARLPERGAGLFDLDPEIRIGRVVYRVAKDAAPEAVAQMLDDVLPRLTLLSDRLSLLRTMGWRAQRAEKLAPAEDLDRQADAVIGEVFARSAEQLAAEPDLGWLIHLAREARGAEELREWARARINHPLFLLSAFASTRGEVRNSAGRHLQLRWDVLIELFGEDPLIEVVSELPEAEAWPRPLNEDEAELLRQARVYAADPDRAREHMLDYRRRYSPEETDAGADPLS